MNVSDVMSSDVHVIEMTDSVADAAQLMDKANTGCLVVVNEGALEGIITERDLVLGCLVEGHVSTRCKVTQHMNSVTESAHPYMDMGNAAIMMLDDEISFLPVIEGNQVVGLVFAEDVSRAIELEDEPQPILI